VLSKEPIKYVAWVRGNLSLSKPVSNYSKQNSKGGFVEEVSKYPDFINKRLTYSTEFLEFYKRQMREIRNSFVST
jgi:hypothetical protein